MSEFIKRLTAPPKSSKYYYSDNIFYKCGYGMPNCTCYAWGRWYELLKKIPKLCTANAENWFNYTKDGYKRGQTPKLGAICVWSKGKIGVGSDGAGHVAVVEEIYKDGSILTSNSAWGGTNFYTKKYEKGYKLSGYTFLGFIYPPVEYTQSNSYSIGIGRNYVVQVDLKVRHDAGIDKGWKLRSELTRDGQNHAYPQKYAVLRPGTTVTALELKSVDGDLWVRIPSGWIAALYKDEVYLK